MYTLQNPANSGGANYTIDNLLFPTGSTYLDSDGFNYELTSYTGPAGGIFGNIWGTAPTITPSSRRETEAPIQTGGDHLALTYVPEGGVPSLYLLLAGAVCFGGLRGSPRRL